MQVRKPTVHPVKEIFHRHGVTHRDIAFTLNVGSFRVWEWLNGYRTPPAEFENRLNELAETYQRHA